MPVAANVAPVSLQTNQRPWHRLLRSNVHCCAEAWLHSIEFLYLRVSIEDGPALRLEANASFCGFDVVALVHRLPVELHRDDTLKRPDFNALPFAEGLAVLQDRPSVRATYPSAAYTEQAARFAVVALHLQRPRPVVLYGPRVNEIAGIGILRWLLDPSLLLKPPVGPEDEVSVGLLSPQESVRPASARNDTVLDRPRVGSGSLYRPVLAQVGQWEQRDEPVRLRRYCSGSGNQHHGTYANRVTPFRCMDALRPWMV